MIEFTLVLMIAVVAVMADEPVAAGSAAATAPVKAESEATASDKSQLKPAEAPDETASPTAASPTAASPTAGPTAASPTTAGPDSAVTDRLQQPSERDLPKSEARPTVAFITNVKYLTPNRPSWVESAPTYEGELLKVSVKAGPYQTIRNCEPDLEREVSLAVAEFTNDHLRAPHASTFIRYSLKDLRTRKVVRDQFSEQLETSLGLMNQVHAQLVFDDQFRNELDQRWSEIKSKSRLAQTGLGAGIVLLFLGTLFSFLKLDTVTRGYYTGRLQFSAAATILALVAASVLLMKWIPWM